jgi:hypothetical protein
MRFLWHAPTELFKRREDKSTLSQGRGLAAPFSSRTATANSSCLVATAAEVLRCVSCRGT